LSNAAAVTQVEEEFNIFALRFFHFMNLWTIYTDLLSKKYVPSPDSDEYPVKMTLMFVVYGNFYSLVEDSGEALNGFRVWRKRFPQEEAVLAAVEARVRPFLSHLRVFRNRMGFHGSRTQLHQSPAFDLFNQHSGAEIFEAMKSFKAMSAALFGMDTALQENDLEGIARQRKKLDEIAARHSSMG
jgi:hypothetical protein